MRGQISQGGAWYKRRDEWKEKAPLECPSGDEQGIDRKRSVGSSEGQMKQEVFISMQ